MTHRIAPAGTRLPPTPLRASAPGSSFAVDLGPAPRRVLAIHVIVGGEAPIAAQPPALTERCAHELRQALVHALDGALPIELRADAVLRVEPQAPLAAFEGDALGAVAGRKRGAK